jgi:threonine synthase
MRWSFRCPSCGAEYRIEPGRYLCDRCSSRNAPGMPLNGVLECAFEDELSKARHQLAPGTVPLPVEREFFPHIPVGDTPLWPAERLRAELGFPGLWLKDDTCEPSGSIKDRASFLVAAFARKHNIKEVALASTGNAASSMACVGAAAGIKVTVFLPKSAPAAKRVQVLQYGAELREIDGNYDLAYDRCLAYTNETGVLSRNTAYNPLTIEGKKTAAFEIVRELKARGVELRARAPDHVFVPTGDGVVLSGLIRGFEDLQSLGEIDRVPKVWAAQAEGSSAIARALKSGEFEFFSSDTIADSIAVDAPRNGPFALAKLRKHGGAAVVVSDAEILAAQRLASSLAGLFAEPSSACALAAFIKARPSLREGDIAVVMLTGSGLKDIKSAARGIGAQA